MERQRFRRMGFTSLLALAAAAFSSGNVERHKELLSFNGGGYNNSSHGFTRSRKLKARTKGQQPRRSKSQRRARAA